LGRLIELARAEAVAVAKHGRPVIVMMAVEEFERMMALDAPAAVRAPKRKAKQ
jgi:prevent-host-death family protein